MLTFHTLKHQIALWHLASAVEWDRVGLYIIFFFFFFFFDSGLLGNSV